MKIKETAGALLNNLRTYWRTPPKGRYMPYREIASLSVGGIGVRFIVSCVSQMILSTGNSLIGNTIGIDPNAMYAIQMISLLSGFPLTALRARMIDNTRSMKGKYRPYILTMGIPTVVLACAFTWMPYETMSLFTKCAVVLAFNIGFQFFFNFFNDAYNSLINVLSPNSIERSDVLSIRSVIENLSPSIYNILFPLLARLITGENTLYDLSIYRVLFPPLLFFSFMLSIIVYTNTEEKIVQAKTHCIQIKFIDAFRAVARNKYFWIISLAGWVGFLESAFKDIMQWMYEYQKVCEAGTFSLITAIASNASFWPNLVAPFLIRKYGKKKILIVSNALSIGFIALMLPVVRMTHTPGAIWLLLACTFANQFITSLGHLLGPSVDADIRDYQHYISGERIDGMFSAVGLIGNVVTMGTGFILPMIYEKAGLNRQTALSLGLDGSNVYHVLYDQSYFVNITSILIVASIFGAAMNVIPFFFYDFTEVRQKATVKVLKIRALFEDYANNVLSDEALVESIDIINEAKEYCDKTPHDLSNANKKLKKAKKTLPKDEYSLLKAEINQQREENEKTEIAKFIINELNKFETPEGKIYLENAKLIANAGLNGFLSVELPSKREARVMPKTTEEEKNRRRNMLMQIQDTKAARKAVKKYYPNGITEFDVSCFDELFKREDAAEEKLFAVSKEMKQAKEAGNKDKVSQLKQELLLAKKEKAVVNREIKEMTLKNSIYHRAAKPYLDAKKVIAQAQNYAHLDEIEKLYDDAKQRLESKTVAASV